MISVLTNGKIKFGPGGTRTTEELRVLESATLGTVNRLNTPHFTGDDLILLKSYIILATISDPGGSGQIIEKTVKDTRWKVQASKSVSPWMDKAYRMIEDAKSSTMNTIAFSQVLRSDAVMKSLQLDNTGSPQYGDPSRGEW
jgi:hypothetical protein